jgi:peptidoglycan hydrolase-like protein with peptidoglycan-binding domain
MPTPPDTVGTLALSDAQAPMVAVPSASSTAPAQDPPVTLALPPTQIIGSDALPPTSPSAPSNPVAPSVTLTPQDGSSNIDLFAGRATAGPGPMPSPPGLAPAPLAPAPPDGGSTITGDPTGSLAPAPGQSEIPTAGPPGAIPPQPVVAPPPAGHWKLDEILANSEYSGYSRAGRSYVVYKAQLVMKQSADGVPGKGTYTAIQKFQTENGLQPTGQLDSATLAAMSLSGQPDNSNWGSGGSRGSSDRTPESEKTKFRKMFEKKVLGGRDLKDLFRR